jgi:ADP-heptose:LPS heptosyltransferase
LILAWIAEGSKDSEKPLYLNASGIRRELLQLFGQTVVDQDGITQAKMVKAEHAIRYSQSRMPFRSRQLGIKTAHKRPTPTVSHAATAWAKQCMGDDTVLLCPQSVHKEREWDIDQWVELAHILEINQVPFLIMGSQAKRELTSFPGMYSLSPMERNVALYQQAKAVVAIDSFPANLAGTLNIPSIVILTTTTQFVFDHCPSIQCVRGALENAHSIYQKLRYLLDNP